MNCNHVWKMYTGLTDSFEYCTGCDVKKGQEVAVAINYVGPTPQTKEYKTVYRTKSGALVESEELESAIANIDLRKHFVRSTQKVIDSVYKQCIGDFKDLYYSENPMLAVLPKPEIVAQPPLVVLSKEEQIINQACERVQAGKYANTLYMPVAEFEEFKLDILNFRRSTLNWVGTSTGAISANFIKIATHVGYVTVFPTVHLGNHKWYWFKE